MMLWGRGQRFWQQALCDDDLPVRLFALRALAREGQFRFLLEQASPSLGYPLVWALAQCPDPNLLAQGSSDSPARAARFLCSRRGRQPSWRKKANLQRCLIDLWEAVHPLKALACAVRLLELHREMAIPGLLQGIQRDQHSDLCAWALGQLGLVKPLLYAFAGATPRARHSLALGLWYLGPDADAAIPDLIEDASPASRAALVTMMEASAPALIEARLAPVWLDEEALNQLALLAFDVDPRLRHYAAEALCGFGPAATQALPILREMLRSHDYAAATALTRQSIPELSAELREFQQGLRAPP